MLNDLLRLLANA